MAKNEFKPFAIGAGANVTPQADWEEMPALCTGFQSGKASSAQVNKAIRQASFVASALAQFVAEKTGKEVLDDGDVSGFIALLTSGFGKQYLSRNNPFEDIKNDGSTAISTALGNLGFQESSTSFQLGSIIIKFGNSGAAVPVSGYQFAFPTPFPTTCYSLLITGWQLPIGHTGRNKFGAKLTVSDGMTATGFDYIAIGA